MLLRRVTGRVPSRMRSREIRQAIGARAYAGHHERTLNAREVAGLGRALSSMPQQKLQVRTEQWS